MEYILGYQGFIILIGVTFVISYEFVTGELISAQNSFYNGRKVNHLNSNRHVVKSIQVYIYIYM